MVAPAAASEQQVDSLRLPYASSNVRPEGNDVLIALIFADSSDKTINNSPLNNWYIPAARAYGVYNFQLIRYSRACGSFQDFLDRGLLLTRKLLNQVFLLVKLNLSLRKFYGHHHDLVDRYGISVPQMTPVLSSFTTYYRVCN